MMLLTLSGSLSQAAELSPIAEYQLKAAFIYNFIKFVDWPEKADTGAATTICLGILGKDQFGDSLDTIKGKSVRGKTIVVRHFRRMDEVKGCQILFISSSESGRLVRILKSLPPSPVLTVADQNGFNEAGGMINLVTLKNRVGFTINNAAARRAGLHVSSHLLKLAQSVIEQ